MIDNTLGHDFLIVKLNAQSSLDETLTKSFLSNYWQTTKVNIRCSSWSEFLLGGIPQGSVLGFFFNVYYIYIFYIIESANICDYAAETTFHAWDSGIGS